jgi:hypothetical protein
LAWNARHDTTLYQPSNRTLQSSPGEWLAPVRTVGKKAKNASFCDSGHSENSGLCYSFFNDERANSFNCQSGGSRRKDKREHVMTSIILTAVAASFLIVGAWAADLACYHPHADSVDPTAPIDITAAWK